MSQITNPYQNYCDSPNRHNELFLMKRDSNIFIDSNYDPENELNDLQKDQIDNQGLFEDYCNLISWGDGSKPNKIFKSWDSEIVWTQRSIASTSHLDSEFFQPPTPTPTPTPNPTPSPPDTKKFIDKSYCRYILLYVFRTIENKQYAEIITDICSQYQVNYEHFIEYYRKQRILIMGYQALKKELIYDNDTIFVQKRKQAFKEVLNWYLDKLATKHILQSKKQNFKEYLKFKNYVMSYYIHTPKTWAGNKPQWN